MVSHTIEIINVAFEVETKQHSNTSHLAQLIISTTSDLSVEAICSGVS